MKPFFSFYGGKYRLAPRYPDPVYETVIEPFAGSAGYSVRHPEKHVRLYDLDEKVVATWQYLIKVSEQEILSLPDLGAQEDVRELPLIDEARWLIGWWLNKGMTAPCNRPSKWMREPLPGRLETYWGPGIRNRIASQLQGIRHWSAEQASYLEIPDSEATWFIDPPYIGTPGSRYVKKNSAIDYQHLADWCRSRTGQVIVCENEGATWLPFRHLTVAKATRNGGTGTSTEVMYYQDPIL